MEITEHVTIENGQGLFEIADQCGTILYFDGKPLGLGFDDMQGSVAQYFAHLDYSSDKIEKYLADIRNYIENGVPPLHSLAQIFHPLIKLLPAGTHKLKLHDSFDKENEESLLEQLSHFKNKKLDYFEHYYPYDCIFNLKFFQDPSKLNTERIHYFSEQIKKGKRPLIIILSHNWFNFVIDGHHKAIAYTNNNIVPHFLEIKTKTKYPSRYDGYEILNKVEEIEGRELLKKPKETFEEIVKSEYGKNYWEEK